MDIPLGVLFGILSMLAWGIGDFFLAKVSKITNPLRIAFWNQVIGVAFLTIPLIFFFEPKTFTPWILLSLVIVSILNLSGFLTFCKAFRIGPVSIVGPVANSYAALAAVLGILLLRESITLVRGVGILLVILGAVLGSIRMTDLRKLKFKMSSKGVPYALSTFLTWGVSFFWVADLVKRLGWFMPSYLLGVGVFVCILVYAGIRRENLRFPRQATYPMIGSSILFATAYLSYSAGLFTDAVSVVAPIAAAAPIVLVVLARLFLKERLETNQQIGVMMLLIGIIALSF